MKSWSFFKYGYLTRNGNTVPEYTGYIQPWRMPMIQVGERLSIKLLLSLVFPWN